MLIRDNLHNFRRHFTSCGTKTFSARMNPQCKGTPRAPPPVSPICRSVAVSALKARFSPMCKRRGRKTASVKRPPLCDGANKKHLRRRARICENVRPATETSESIRVRPHRLPPHHCPPARVSPFSARKIKNPPETTRTEHTAIMICCPSPQIREFRTRKNGRFKQSIRF